MTSRALQLDLDVLFPPKVDFCPQTENVYSKPGLLGLTEGFSSESIRKKLPKFGQICFTSEIDHNNFCRPKCKFGRKWARLATLFKAIFTSCLVVLSFQNDWHTRQHGGYNSFKGEHQKRYVFFPIYFCNWLFSQPTGFHFTFF